MLIVHRKTKIMIIIGLKVAKLDPPKMPPAGLFQPQMRKITLWLSQLPVKGTQFAVNVF